MTEIVTTEEGEDCKGGRGRDVVATGNTVEETMAEEEIEEFEEEEKKEQQISLQGAPCGVSSCCGGDRDTVGGM